jgi:hypothetical protein
VHGVYSSLSFYGGKAEAQLRQPQCAMALRTVHECGLGEEPSGVLCGNGQLPTEPDCCRCPSIPDQGHYIGEACSARSVT